MISTPVIRIEVVSDIVCPWCYIGKKRMEKAVAAAGHGFDFRISYLPFELNPHLPAAGVNYRDHLAEKFGGEEQYELLTSRVAAVAREEGLVLDYDRQKTLPNTAQLHVLMQAAGDRGAQAGLAEAFFRAFFTEGVDLADRGNIIDTALAAGMEKSAIEAALSDADMSRRVRQRENDIRAMGIHGVPFYIVNGEFGISGAQPVEHFTKVFRKAVPEGSSSRSAPA